MVDSVVWRSVYSLRTITETEATDVVISEGALQESCCSRQTDARLVEHISS